VYSTNGINRMKTLKCFAKHISVLPNKTLHFFAIRLTIVIISVRPVMQIIVSTKYDLRPPPTSDAPSAMSAPCWRRRHRCHDGGSGDGCGDDGFRHRRRHHRRLRRLRHDLRFRPSAATVCAVAVAAIAIADIATAAATAAAVAAAAAANAVSVTMSLPFVG
jgi:hypothetical protein